jgi:hypothetical protein
MSFFNSVIRDQSKRQLKNAGRPEEARGQFTGVVIAVGYRPGIGVTNRTRDAARPGIHTNVCVLQVIRYHSIGYSVTVSALRLRVGRPRRPASARMAHGPQRASARALNQVTSKARPAVARLGQPDWASAGHLSQVIDPAVGYVTSISSPVQRQGSNCFLIDVGWAMFET